MDVLGAVLGIRIEVQGMQQVLSSLGSLKSNLAAAAIGVAGITAELKLMGTALAAAGTDESMRLTLGAITHSGSMALDQIRMIREETNKGIFGKSDIFEAVKRFDLAKQSISDLLPLSEEFAARSGQSLGAVSKYISEIAGGGSARLQQFFKSAGITIQQLRTAGLSVSDHYEIGNSPATILQALKGIAGQNSITGALGGGWDATVRGLSSSMTELWRSIGDGLLPVIKPLVSWLATLVQWITNLNDWTHGLLSDFIILATSVRLVGAILPLFGSVGLIPSIRALVALTSSATAAAVALRAVAASAGANAATGAGSAAVAGAEAGNGFFARIGAWLSDFWANLAGPVGLGNSIKWIVRALAPFAEIIALFTGLLSGAILGMGEIFHLIDPRIQGPSSIAGEHIHDLMNGDPDWALQRGDARRHHAQPYVPTPADRPVKRDDVERMQVRAWARSYA